MVDARGSAYRAGHGRPQRLVRVQDPAQPRIGLELESGVIIVLELGAEREREISPQLDFILDERTVEVLIQNGRGEPQPRRIDDGIMRVAIAQAPGDPVARA